MIIFILVMLILTASAREVSQLSTRDANYVTEYMLQYDRQMQSPTIEPYVREYTLDKGAGSETFRCVSSSSISWYRQENSPWTSTVLAACSAPNQSHGSHCASITFTNASIGQVGRYYCAKDPEVRQYREQHGWTNDDVFRLHLADLEAEFHATSFYLFVDDPEQPLVPGNSIIAIGHVLHVPCKPTSSRVEVDLIGMDGQPVEGVYSSTDGVTISSGPYYYHNRFFCRDHFDKQYELVFKNRSDEFEEKPHYSSIDKYVVKFEPKFRIYPARNLDSKVTATYNVIPSGTRVHLVCGSGFKNLNLSIFPAAVNAEKANGTVKRLLSMKFKSTITRMENATIKELVIEPTKVEHSGTYRCETPKHSHSNITYFSSLKLYILNSTEDFIYFMEGNTNATTIRVRNESRTGGQDTVPSKPVTIAFNYEYYAEKVSCSWFRDDTPTEALCGNCTERYEIQRRGKGTSLTILRPSIWESGRYTVECRLSNGIKRNTSRDVFIEGDWEVALSPKRVEMVSSDPIELVCRSRGVDSPTFQLYFIECDYQTWDKCRDTGDKEQLETISNSMHRTAFEVYHVFVITPKEFGIVVCEVLSEHGTRRTETLLQNSESEAKAILNSKIITKVLAIATVGVLLFVGIVWGYRKYTEGMAELPKAGGNSTDGAGGDSISFLPDVYKIPREQVQLYKRLGQGEFGVTWMAKVSGMSEDPSLETVVAVKEPKERNNRQMLIALVSELKVHVHVGHHLNVVNLLGAVVDNVGEGELLLVIEYCRFGNMKHFLQQNRPHFENNFDDGLFGSGASDSAAAGYPFSTTDLLYWASQIACGMEYLSTSGIIHGDLAARNVLLCEGSIVKVGDFGMARVTRRDDVYRKSDNDALLPLAWMAVESIRDRIFSTSSDVWAYGVLLWELFSLGTEPYSTVLADETILILLTQGYRMENPAYAPAEIYSLISNCWEEDPCARPTFKELFNDFNSRLPNRLRKQYARLNEPYMHMSALEKAGSQKTPLRVYVNESVWSPQNASKDEQTTAIVITKPKMPLPTEQTVERTSQIIVVDSEMKAQQSFTEHSSQVEQISEDTFLQC